MKALALASLAPARSLMQRETLTDALWDELMPLLEAHWREIQHYPDIPLALDLDGYAAAQHAGCLRTYTARRDGALVGYACFVVRAGLHHRTSLQATQDALYLAPEARSATGAAFIRWCDAQLQAEGVQVVYQHVTSARDFGPLLERLGYSQVERIYSKRLDGGPL
jgi:hypothetical protein